MSWFIEKAINGIIRPPRFHYDKKALLNFPVDPSGNIYTRANAPLLVSRDDGSEIKLDCSIYYAMDTDISGKNCVIYLHGNASSQLEGLFLVPNLCRLGICVVCFDFAGCGNSDGEYISLGYYEERDTVALIDDLSQKFGFQKFVLWGRSMGAATSILVKHELLAGIVVDSAYTSIIDAVTAIAVRLEIPRVVIPACLSYLRRKISNRAGFDLESVSVVEAAKAKDCVPMLMGHAKDDEFIPCQQGREIFDHYNSDDKVFEELPGGHNSSRGEVWLKKAFAFILRVFDMNDKLDMIGSLQHTKLSESNEYHFKNYEAMISGDKK